MIMISRYMRKHACTQRAPASTHSTQPTNESLVVVAMQVLYRVNMR